MVNHDTYVKAEEASSSFGRCFLLQKRPCVLPYSWRTKMKAGSPPAFLLFTTRLTICQSGSILKIGYVGRSSQEKPCLHKKKVW